MLLSVIASFKISQLKPIVEFLEKRFRTEDSARSSFFTMTTKYDIKGPIRERELTKALGLVGDRSSQWLF